MTKQLPRPEDYSPFTKLMGLVITQPEIGKCRITMEAQEKLQNNYGTVHGGAIYAMVDVGMGAALYFSLNDEEICTTVEIKITYLKPVTSGTLVCDARVISRTKRLGTTEAEVTSEGNLVAKATGTFYISKDRGQDIHSKNRAKESAETVRKSAS